MIYSHVINEARNINFEDILKSPLELMQEYYENEISILNTVLEYKESINESTDLESLEEGFAGNVKEKVKTIINKFIEWVKKIFESAKNLIFKKHKETKVQTESVKKQILMIEHNPDLDKKEKEVKKAQAVKPITKSKGGEDNREQTSGKKKYKYIKGIESISIRSIGFSQYNEIFDNIEYDIKRWGAELNSEDLAVYSDKLDEIKLDKSADEYWKEITSKFTTEKELTPDEIVKIVEANTKSFENYKEIVNKMEGKNDKFINELKKIINRLNKEENNANLTAYATLINKVVNISKQYTQINLQIVARYANSLKPVEIS